MSDDETLILTDHQDRQIRLTGERRDHILDRSEMEAQFERVHEAITAPQIVVATTSDESVYVYHRYYDTTPVTSKFLLVAVKILDDDAFILTAFFSSRQKKGRVIWQA